MKNTLKLFSAVLVILTLLVILLCSPPTVARATLPQTNSVVFAKTTLNIRNAPSTDGKILGVLNENNTLPLIEKKDRWHKVDFDGQVAYVSANEKYCGVTVQTVVPNASTAKYIKANVTLNVRDNCSSTAKVVGKIDSGDLLPYDGVEGEWYKTTYRGKSAYVSSHSSYTTLIELKTQNHKVENIIKKAQNALGSDYVFGATRQHDGLGNLNVNFSPLKFDCSSLTQYAFFEEKILIGQTSRAQSLSGIEVQQNAIKRGDLLFFTNSDRQHLSGIERIGHVAIYLGDDYILHTSTDFAVIEKISSRRYANFITARRLVLD